MNHIASLQGAAHRNNFRITMYLLVADLRKRRAAWQASLQNQGPFLGVVQCQIAWEL